MKVSQYIKDKGIAMGLALLACVLTSQFLAAMGTAFPVIVLTETIFAGCLSLMGIYDCMRKKHYYDKLMSTWEELEEKTYLSEMIECPGFYDGRLLYEIVKRNGKYLNDVICEQQQEMMEYKDYVQTWVHEIKTPIAVQRLLIENNKNPITSSIEEEVGRIEAYVEQMLYYTKSGSLEGDYFIQPADLKKLVMEVIRKNTKLMVAQGTIPRLENLGFTVLTDCKWMEFILGQIVINAVKYKDDSKKSSISFSAEEEGGGMVALTVADNGIGIPKKDIGRVFQKGFTGENGRIYHKSTGMGLYLCKSLCDKMGIEINLDSVQGQGTKVIFHLKQYHE